MIFEHKLLKRLSLHVQELNCEFIFNELEVHVGEEALSLNLTPNLGFVRKIEVNKGNKCQVATS
jgi:hypothetical protein